MMNTKLKIALVALLVVAAPLALILVDSMTSPKKDEKKKPEPAAAGTSIFSSRREADRKLNEEGVIVLSSTENQSPVDTTKTSPPVNTEKTETKAMEPASAEFEEYVIKSGDTLGSIAAKKYGDESKWPVIAEANPQVKPTALRIGQKLKLPAKLAPKATTNEPPAVENGPAGRTYTVQVGDTLGEISKKSYGTARFAGKIAEANQLPSPDDLQVGAKLVLPEIAAPRKESATEPTPEVLAGKKVHKIQAKDVLWNIADKYRGERGVLEMIDLIVKSNPSRLKGPDTVLRVGWDLVIPD